jgi:hypothetical protein
MLATAGIGSHKVAIKRNFQTSFFERGIGSRPTSGGNKVEIAIT